MKKRVMLTTLLGAALVSGLLTGCGTTSNPGGQAPTKQTDNSGTNTGTNGGQQAAQPSGKQYAKAPAMQIDKNKTYTAVIHTNKGDITVNLLANKAPITVNNFVFLAKDHFYDNVKFHRVIKDFMIQTGDPTATGMGGPGYQFQDELPPAKPYAKGIVAMANAGPNTNGSQFFIGSGAQVDALNKMPNYTVFGEVTQGLDVVDKIASVPVAAGDTGEASKPTEDVHMNSIDITEK
jgi:cyclophilin family peptidyl-prolyl cis-trans isomerase